MRIALRYLFILSLVLAASSTQAALPAYDSSGRALPSLSPMLKQVNPAVVNIATFSKKQSYNPLLNDPFFRHFFNIPEEQPRDQRPTKRQQSAGSGVIVDAKQGLVITNYHVIKGADEVQVSLEDGRVFTAEVEGSDPDLDIAILKITAKNLQEVSITDSNDVLVGDFVVAIGNPFGLGQTVTTGIVSALGRSGLGIEGFENFIQTDASINPGNSGGALVNLRGELVGINTAIIAPSGGNVGIGFAIPINMAKASMDQIIEYGEVRRGRIGVQIQDLSRELRQQFGLKNGQQGVLIAGVQLGSPAEDARLQSGDIVTAVDGKKVSSTGQLSSQISIKSIGDKVDLTIIRGDKEQRIRVSVGDPISASTSGGKVHSLLEGALFDDNSGGEGVMVMSMAPNSPAVYSGLRVGDVILGVNRKNVKNLRAFRSAIAEGGDSILLHVERDGRSFYVVIQ
ncbi:MAG: DegQ family serine endoprotease [Cellvibrionaceae bacterium]|nr:DegQ family serine endoprotease [Cellvibrionaceae bacterium]